MNTRQLSSKRLGDRQPFANSLHGVKLQRKCACGGTPGLSGECEKCRREKLQRKALTSELGIRGEASVLPLVHEVLRSPGQPLDPANRAFMEPRFGHDFSDVRVHSDSQAADSAAALDAAAYTLGRHVVFGAGRFDSKSPGGRQLLAHELVHAVQQGKSGTPGPGLEVDSPSSAAEIEAQRVSAQVVQNQAARPVVRQNLGPAVSRTPTEGTSVFSNTATIQTTTTPVGPGAQGSVYGGRVEREEFKDEAARRAGQSFFSRSIPVEYDEQQCELRVPFRLQFRNATAADINRCYPEPNQRPPAPLSSGELGRLGQQFLEAVNSQLNGWYTARIDGCAGVRCAGREIPIRVQAVQATGQVDCVVAFSNASGRACATFDGANQQSLIVLYRSDLGDRWTSSHESGHAALGIGDEYRETVLPGKPPERVRDRDWSLMADSSGYRGWSMLHARHFAFATAFMEAALVSGGHTGCHVTLTEIPRPAPIDVTLSVTLGYARLGGPTLHLGAGLNLGIPLNRRREWQALLGLQGSYFLSATPGSQEAFLLGLRAGFLHRTTPSAGGLRLGGFAEVGAGRFSASGPARWSPYGEVGGSLGYGGAPASGLIPFLSAEVAVGTELDLSVPDRARWFRAGLNAGFTF
jgi:hypothetical protein